MTTVWEQFDDVAGSPARGTVTAAALSEREAADGDARVTASEHTGALVAGRLELDLEPGPAVIRVAVTGAPAVTRRVLVPASGTHRLSSLLDAVVEPATVGVLTTAQVGVLVPGFDADGHVLDAHGDPVVVPPASHVTTVTALFPTPAATWQVPHTLGRYPAAVTVVVGTSEVLADVDYPSTDLVVVTHAQPAAGRVHLI